MSIIVQHIDVDIALGVEVDETTKARAERVVYRIDLSTDKVADRLGAIRHFREASREDRSTMARMFGFELPAGTV